jgi:hypothetical protein
MSGIVFNVGPLLRNLRKPTFVYTSLVGKPVIMVVLYDKGTEENDKVTEY